MKGLSDFKQLSYLTGLPEDKFMISLAKTSRCDLQIKIRSALWISCALKGDVLRFPRKNDTNRNRKTSARFILNQEE